MISSSLNRLFFISFCFPFRWQNFSFQSSTFSGPGHDGFTIHFDGFVTDVGNFADGTVSGKVMQFGVSAIPEPSTWALLALGAGVLAWRRRRAGM